MGVQTDKEDSSPHSVMSSLKEMYKTKILPFEELTFFSRFGCGELSDSDFDSNPMVLLMGPYSSGKTTFIENLIGRQYPGSKIGPEPTTDTFNAIMPGGEDRIIPGNALVVTPNTPFHGLQTFGNSFLTRFQGCYVSNCPFLTDITIIDTPGILSGKKQSNGRAYDFQKVLEWFVDRADMIILLFDVQKIDLSDEMATAVKCLGKHADKIRVVMNKSDSLSHQQLMKVYGAMQWSLGRIITTPEVTKVYIGSFWSEPLKNQETNALIVQEMGDLMKDISMLPKMGVVRKINDMVKRLRLLRAQALLLDHLRGEMPGLFGKDKKQKALLDDLPSVFRSVMAQHALSAGDFPDLDVFRKGLEGLDFKKIPKIKVDQKGIKDLNKALKVTIPDLLFRLPGAEDFQQGLNRGEK
jgi:GTPase SAR1 family protein